METIRESTLAYEDWLRAQLDGGIVEKDLAKKHEKMAKESFVFLRATYWRWAETILDVCPDLGNATPVLAVGDIHVENYGTWRDADGRLAWGVNDFDEASEMPYTLDLVRLATSALLGRMSKSPADAEICTAIIEGYCKGLAEPQAIVLDRDHLQLREAVVVPDAERTEFWKDIAKLKSADAPQQFRTAIVAAMPEQQLDIKMARRSAGAGSLGRPRWAGIADWRGAPVVREAKALVVSAWDRAHRPKVDKIRVGELLDGRYRAIDPWQRIDGKLAVRRLSPNNRKIEADKNPASLFTPDMLENMGFELANVHLGKADHRDAISHDLDKRKAGWLAANAKLAAEAVERDFDDWKAG